VIANRSGTLFRANEAASFSLAFSALLLAPVGVATDGADLIDASVLLIVGLTSILSTVIPNMLEFRLTRRITAQVHGVLVSLNPAVGTVVGAVLLSQALGIMSLVAVAIIGAGATLAYRASREQRASPALSNAMAH
jgi:inner membrane transporter RhtA